MARIFISYYKVQEVPMKKVLGFWEGLFKELAGCGNEVLYLNTAYFNTYDSNIVSNSDLDSVILNKVKQSDPEIIITFNHRIPMSILDNFNIPIVIWDGDELSYFCDLPYIKEHIDRYILLSMVEGWKQDYLDFGFKKEQIFYVPMATAVRNQDIAQTVNISFLGARHYHSKKINTMIRSGEYSKELYSMIQHFLNNCDFDFDRMFNEQFSETITSLKVQDIYPLFDNRWLDLASVLDLGLRISGNGGRWEDLAPYMPQLVTAYKNQPVWSLQENEDFYNISKISLCPIAPQARGAGFSWRVWDIMASNACLLVSESLDLKALVSGHVDIPMYHTPWEARQYCIDLLKDDDARKQIVAQSQQYVDKNARWIHRFRDLEHILHIELVAIAKEGSIEDLMLDTPSLIEQFCGREQRKFKTWNQKVVDLVYFARDNGMPWGVCAGIGMLSPKFIVQSSLNHIKRTNIIKKRQFDNDEKKRKQNWKEKSKSHNQIRVMMYCNLPSIWNSFNSLYRLLKSDSRFQVDIVVFPEMERGGRLKNYDMIDFCNRRGFEYIEGYNKETGEYIDLTDKEYDYIFLNRPYQDLRPRQYSTSALRIQSKLCHITYATCIFKGSVQDTVCGFQHLKYYDFVFAETTIHKKIYLEYKKKYVDCSTEVCTVGSPKFEEVLKCDYSKKSNDKFVILYTPRWNLTDGTCSFLDLYEYFFDLVKDHNEIEYIFRPHPLMEEQFKKTIWKNGEWNKFVREFDGYENASIDLSPDYLKTFKQADVLISDVSSMLAEFMLTKKPIIYMHKTDEIFNEFGLGLAEGYYHCNTAEEVQLVLSQLQNGKDTLKTIRDTIIDKYFYFPQNGVADAIRERLLNDFYQTTKGAF